MVSFQPYTQLGRSSFFRWLWKVNSNVVVMAIVLRTDPQSAESSDRQIKRLSLKEFYFLFRFCLEYLDPIQKSFRNHSLLLRNPSSEHDPVSEQKDEIKSFQEDNLCCICMDRLADSVLSCAHNFCGECIYEWRKGNDSCPVCRAKDLTSKKGDPWIFAQISDQPDNKTYELEVTKYFWEYLQDRLVFTATIESNCASSVPGPC